MFLKRIEISGFKSFARKTVLEFSGSSGGFPITAIVGPNGSGKSNVADAIRWAIGEQSAKHLRGKKGEDVIFAGTDKKARLGSASVSLFFENKDKRIPIEYEEVTVTRRLFRSGESEYLLNGARVRLLDITDLLARASIGRDSYSVITQGMSDAVLSASPAERRIFLEEAAGVKQYRLEKERAIRKLESTKQNIAQVEALLREIEPHLKHLRKQAERASRGQELEKTLRTKQERRFSFLRKKYRAERANFFREKEIMEEHIRTLEERVQKIHEELSVESQRSTDETPRKKSEEENRLARENLYQLERELALLLGRIETEEERRKPRTVTESVPVDRTFVRSILEEIRVHQEKLIDRISHVESLEELQELRELARVVATRLFELHEQAGKDSIVTTHTVSLSPEEKEKSDEHLRLLISKQGHTQGERDRLKERIAENERLLERFAADMEQSRKKFFELERSSREAEHQLSNEKERASEWKVRMARVEVREEDLAAEIFEELHVVPDELPPLPAEDDEIDPEKLERDILRLKVELEHIGGIDKTVVEECEETEKRFSFLTSESEDLKRAVESLRSVIREMETKTETAFESAWKEVNKEFDRYFKIIFGGGSASLRKRELSRSLGENTDETGVSEGDRLTGEDSDFGEREAGIDIVATPPGKRIANLSMLSGGERSLVALALLFAIISHKPPPFAVLDEVEAALDESNSKRFGDLLRELSQKTQFVAITHNRETMRRAALLYGVTMGDDGISKVLSVRLDDVEKEGTFSL